MRGRGRSLRVATGSRGGTPVAGIFRQLEVLMKVRIRRSNTKRRRALGFLARSKTKGGRKIIKRQRKRYGAYRGKDRK